MIVKRNISGCDFYLDNTKSFFIDFDKKERCFKETLFHDNMGIYISIGRIMDSSKNNVTIRRLNPSIVLLDAVSTKDITLGSTEYIMCGDVALNISARISETVKDKKDGDDDDFTWYRCLVNVEEWKKLEEDNKEEVK